VRAKRKKAIPQFALVRPLPAANGHHQLFGFPITLDDPANTRQAFPYTVLLVDTCKRSWKTIEFMLASASESATNFE
jgi:hypothetical protein